MDALLSVDALVALATLTLMEIVLGIDNIVFLAIVVGRLPEAQRPMARRFGLTLALGMRILLLLTMTWIMSLTRPLVTIWGADLSGRSLILLGGGAFLIYKATREIYDKVETVEEEHVLAGDGGRAALGWVFVQIVVLDLVFSLDSVITAVGMANQVSIMITAMVLAMLVMLLAAGPVGEFVGRHPSVKILALAFLLLIGVVLVAEGLGTHVDKGYVYAAMAFSVGVEMLNLRRRARQMARARA